MGEAYVDPFVVFGCIVAIGFLYIALAIGKAVAAPFRLVPWPGILPGSNPFHAVADAIESAFVAPVNDAIHATEGVLVHFLSDMLNWLAIIIAAPILILEGVHKALTYLWNTALAPRVHALEATFERDAQQAVTRASGAASAGAGAVAKAEAYADSIAAKTLTSAKAYAEKQAGSVYDALAAGIIDLTSRTIPALIAADLAAAGPIGKAIAKAVAAAAGAEGTEIEQAIAGDLAAGGSIARTIAHAVEGVAPAAPDTAAAISAALAAGGSIYNAIHSVVSGVVAAAGVTEAQVEGDIRNALAGITGATGITPAEVTDTIGAALAVALAPGGEIARAIADAIPTTLPGFPPVSVPSVGDLAIGLASVTALVGVIASESGLENASCRAKVKNVCQTDAAAFADLLGGLAAVGFAFNLSELYEVAEGLVGDLSGVIAQAA